MTRTTRSRVLTSLALGSAMLLAACSGGTPADSPDPTDDGATTPGGEEGGTIGVSVPTTEGPFFTAMLYGITDEAEKAGWDFTILSAGGYGEVDTQVSQLETLTTQQVDIILVDPADPTVTEGAITQAVNQGITVVGAGDPAPGAHGSASASHCDVGKDLAVGALELLPDGGDMAVLAGPAGAHWSTERLRCFKEAIDGSGINIVAEQTTDPDVAAGLATATDFLQRFPDVDLIYGADDTVGTGAARAVQAADRCGATKVLTAVFGEQIESLMAEGCADYVTALQPVLIGREAVRLAIALHAGETPGETEIAVPNVAVTPDNMDDVEIDAIRAPSGWKPAM